jgi:RNA polymerase sigma factor (sigma-70 family)
MAFGKLLDVYQERLYWHIRKIVVTHENAEDVLQNTFLGIYRSIEKFQKKSSLLTWMYRIAYNESIRFVEKNKRFQFEVMLAKMDRILLPANFSKASLITFIPNRNTPNAPNNWRISPKPYCIFEIS